MPDPSATEPDPQLEDLLRRELVAAGSTIHAGDRLDAKVAAARLGLRRRSLGRRLGAIAAGLLLVAGTAVVATRDGGGDRDPAEVRSGQRTTTTAGPTTTTTEAPPSYEGWDTMAPMPDAGVTPPDGVVALWTDDELVLWGQGGLQAAGVDNHHGWAYDPARDTWRAIATSPIEAPDQKGVWTGREIVVGPGVLVGQPVERDTARHYAAYDPNADRWRLVPGGPVDPAVAGQPLAWTGSKVVVSGTDYGNVRAGLLDPETGRIGRLPDVPNERDSGSRPFGGTGIVAIGPERLVAISNANSSVTTVSLATPGLDGWETIEQPGVSPFWEPAIEWDGQELFFLPTVSGLGDAEATGYALDPDTRTWRELATPPQDPPSSRSLGWELGSPVWTGSQLFTNLGVYDVATDRWQELPPVPGPLRDTPLARWTGEEVLLLGGILPCGEEPDPTCADAPPTAGPQVVAIDGVRFRPPSG